MSAPSVTAPRLPRLLLVLLVLGGIARVASCFLDRPLHPDEYFQYLEPAWWHLTGVGVEAWEWRDGIRSWVLPAYHGGWLAALRAVGVPDGPALVWFLKAHWALINTSLVYVAYRGGACIARRLTPRAVDDPARGVLGGLVAAFLVAAFPVLVTYGSHTLSEMPSLLCLVAGLVFTLELTESGAERASPAALRKAAAIGVLLSLGACLRIANAPLVLLSPFWLLLTGRFRALLCLIAGALGPALLFALVDLLTWGSLASSFVGYIKFNLVEGKAAQFGTEPPVFYLKQMLVRVPRAMPLIVLPMLLGVRATWPFIFSSVLTLAYLSTQPHKEERFVVLVWALLLIPCGGVVGSWLARIAAAVQAKPTGLRRSLCNIAHASLMLAASFWFVDSAQHAGGRGWPEASRIDAEAWMGKQPDVTFVMIDEPISAAGGLWLGSLAPQIRFEGVLLPNPLISHVLVPANSYKEYEAREAGFERVHEDHEFVVLARPKQAAAASR